MSYFLEADKGGHYLTTRLAFRAFHFQMLPSQSLHRLALTTQSVKWIVSPRRAAEMSSNVANKVAGGIADISVKMADSIIRHLGPSNNYGEQLNNPEKRPHAAKEIAGIPLAPSTLTPSPLYLPSDHVPFIRASFPDEVSAARIG